jgi:peptide/nickel transport system permease protein
MLSTFRRFLRHKGAAVGLAFLLVIVALAVGAPWLFPRSPWAIVGRPFLPPGDPRFLLGTDMLGRDIAAGLVHGARFSLLVGLVSTLVALCIGVTTGALAGYFGRWADDLLMRVTEFFQTIPNLVLLMVLVAFMGPSIRSVVLGIGIVSWPNVARIVRAEVLSLRTREFVEAARVVGKGPFRILLTEVLPNTLSPVIVIASVMVASAILAESALSFLGLGDPNVMTWGYMIGVSRAFLRQSWWMSFFPGMAIVTTVLAINLVGDGLTDALNPRLARRGTL